MCVCVIVVFFYIKLTLFFYKVEMHKITTLCTMLGNPLFCDRDLVFNKTDHMATAIIDRITSNRKIYDAIVGRLAYKNTTMLLSEMGEIVVGEIEATIMNGDMLEVETKSLLERLLTNRLGVHVQCVPCVRACNCARWQRFGVMRRVLGRMTKRCQAAAFGMWLANARYLRSLRHKCHR